MSKVSKNQSNIQDEQAWPEKVTFDYLTQERFNEIHQQFELFGISQQVPYQGGDAFAKNLRKASNLQFDNLIFTTSSNAMTSR